MTIVSQQIAATGSRKKALINLTTAAALHQQYRRQHQAQAD